MGTGLKLQRHLRIAAEMLAKRMQPEVEDGIVMGGGSILAITYDHRRSTDIDLWTKADASSALGKGTRDDTDRRARRLLVRNGQEEQELRVKPVKGGYQIRGVIQAPTEEEPTPYTLTPLDHSGFEESYAGRGRLETPRWETMSEVEILYGKMARIHRGEIKLRDIFDMVVLANRSAETFDSVWAAQDPKARERIVKALKDAPEQLEGKAHGRAIIDTTGQRRQIVQGTAKRIAQALEGNGSAGMPREKEVLKARPRKKPGLER